MQTAVSKTDNNITFEIVGEIDEQGAEALKQSFKDTVDSNINEVIFDFKRVTHIGSAGIGKLLLFYKDIAMENGQVKITNTPSHIFNLFKSMKLDSIFSISS